MSVRAESMEGTKGWHVSLAVGEPNRDCEHRRYGVPGIHPIISSTNSQIH